LATKIQRNPVKQKGKKMSTPLTKSHFQSICIPVQEIEQKEELGAGSFGTVYLGKWQHMDVAIKELASKRLPEKAQEEFEQESLVMKDLRHDNIVLLYGVCVDSKNCLIMQYCSNGSLYHLLQSRQEIALLKRIEWALEIAKGLSYLHNRKPTILHRDLKSLNILIDKHLNAKIADFGLSKVKISSSAASTLKGKMIGTIRWMAPEIMEAETGTTYTKAADIYSYGMIAWELATRTIPYEEVAKETLFMMKILQGKREELPPNTPPALTKVVTGCWKQNPQERLPLDAVIKTLENEQPTPSTPSPHYGGGLGSASPSPSYHSDVYGGGLGSVPMSLSSQPNDPLPEIKNLNVAPPKPTTPSPKATPKPSAKPISKESTLPSMAFGKAKWEKYFGDIGVEPPLPPNIEEILNSPCIFWSGKKVRDTHLLVLVPEKVNGRPFHLDSLAELIKSPKSGHKTKYDYYNSDVKKELGTKSLGSHWALMTKDVIPNSTNKTYDDQKALVQKHAQSSKIPYELPKALEAATAILMHHVETGERLYENIFTRCQEKVDNNQWPAAIGGFAAGGLSVLNDWLVYYYYYYGLGCCRRV
jgi:serine/threonine protein kinase